MYYLRAFNMDIFIALVFVIGYVQCSSNMQPTHENLTQTLSVACWKKDADYSMTIYLVKGTDNIDLVYSVANTDPTDVSIGVFDSDGNGIFGNGTNEDPFTFTITASGDPMTLSSSDISNKKAFIKSPDVIGMHLIAKAIYREPFMHHILFPEDVLYKLYCNFSQIQDDIVESGQIFTSGSIGESAYLIDDTAVLQVLSNNSATTTVALGEPIQLSARAVQPTKSVGVYVYNCSICDTRNCSGMAIDFIDGNGCAIGSYFTSFIGQPDNSAQTSSFAAFILNNQNEIFFRCSLNFCYDPSDPRCSDFCSSNSGGRKKRQAPSIQTPEETEVKTYLRITVNSNRNPLGNSEGEGVAPGIISPVGQPQEQQNTVLLAVIVTLACLLTVGIILFIAFFCRSSKQNSQPE